MISSTTNERIKWIRALQARKRARRDAGAFVLEGKRMAQEVIQAAAPVHLILHAEDLTAEEQSLVKSLAKLGGEVLAATQRVIRVCSDTESPQRILLALPIPNLALHHPLEFALVLDRIGDPGNLGAILRTAQAVGVHAVFLTQGSVDPYNPKVVRAAMGAHLHLPLRVLPEDEILGCLDGLPIRVAQARQGIPYHQIDWTEPTALVVGSESHGPSEVWLEPAMQAVHIPMPGGFESLNAAIATAVLLFEIVRQREVG